MHLAVAAIFTSVITDSIMSKEHASHYQGPISVVLYTVYATGLAEEI
jgi:Ca2+/H+ antiporter